VRHVHNERVKMGSVFGREDFLDGFRVERIGGEPVDRLGGERDDLSALQQSHGATDRFAGVLLVIGEGQFGLHGKWGDSSWASARPKVCLG